MARTSGLAPWGARDRVRGSLTATTLAEGETAVDLEDVFRRRGQDWAEPEKQIVFDWLIRSGELDQLVRRADAMFRCRRDLIDDPYLAAQETVDSKIRDAFRYYDPTSPKAAPFPGYLKTIVKREVTRVIG